MREGRRRESNKNVKRQVLGIISKVRLLASPPLHTQDTEIGLGALV